MPKSSIGDNKVWFSNYMIKELRTTFELSYFAANLGSQPQLFILGAQNYKWYKDNQNKILLPMEVRELVIPNYTQAFLTTRIGASVLVILFPITVIISGSLWIGLILNKTKNKLL